MELLKQRILKDAEVLPGEVLKVDMFLNHLLDVNLIREIGKEFFRIFSSSGITKILTAEASGIALAFAAAEFFNTPVLIAKKGTHKNIGSECYCSEVFSFTKSVSYTMQVSKKYIDSRDTILIIDDFLANGAALSGLINIVSLSHAKLAGAGIAVEKAFQNGGDKLRGEGLNLKSLAVIESMNEGKIIFRDDDDKE